MSDPFPRFLAPYGPVKSGALSFDAVFRTAKQKTGGQKIGPKTAETPLPENLRDWLRLYAVEK